MTYNNIYLLLTEYVMTAGLYASVSSNRLGGTRYTHGSNPSECEKCDAIIYVCRARRRGFSDREQQGLRTVESSPDFSAFLRC